MEQNPKNSVSGASRLISQLAAEKKKCVMALCLIAMMAFMWVRVLGKKSTQGAEAALTVQETARSESNSELKISFIELPNVKGRNDVLTKDFFVVDNWREFVRGGQSIYLGGVGVGAGSKDESEKYIRRVTKKLKLEAIGLGENAEAFINDTLLSVGDKLLIRDGANTHECEIVGIDDNTVLIRCGEVEITLKLTQASVIDY